jgi:outer membrane protein W
MRPARWFVTATISVLGIAVPVTTRAENNVVRLGLEASFPTGDLLPGFVQEEAETAFGPGFSYEYKFTDLFGIEAGISYFNHDLSGGDPSEDIGEVSLVPVLIRGNFHVARKPGFDLYLRPTLGYVFVGDSDLMSGLTVANEDEFALGLGFGFDVPFGGTWAFSAAFDWLAMDVAPEGDECFTVPGSNVCIEEEMDVDPIVARVGVAIRF